MEVGKTKRVNKTKKKEKKQKIEISLYINGVKYEYGLLCTFCTKSKACSHCPDCDEFYCQSCDYTAHQTKKRKHHIRYALSNLTLNRAAQLITFAVRYHGHLLNLQSKCRQIFKRYFDKKTLNYYYFNPVYKTSSWRKPYCLRKNDLAPYMEPEYAASKCQNVYHIWRARVKVREVLLQQYSKIFDRRHGIFYYAYNGQSKLIPKQSWKKPLFLGKRSYPKDIIPIYTLDVAAITIQRKWRAILVKQFFYTLVRGLYDEIWDPVHGKYNYYHRDSEILYIDKPKLLRSQPFDPNRVPDWTIDRVSLFLRRIGLKIYVENFLSYEVDGQTLLLLDSEDYENLNITNKLHIKKIAVEIKKIYKKPMTNMQLSQHHMIRREKIRRIKMYHYAATLIQTNYRMYHAKKEIKMLKEILRIRQANELLQQKIMASNQWYTDVSNLPSLHYTRSGDIIFKKDMINTTTTKKNEVKNEIKLPFIKDFGRHREYLSYRGWGHNETNNQWINVFPSHPTPYSTTSTSFTTSTSMKEKYYQYHPTIPIVEKLRINGYDERRRLLFKHQSQIL